MGDVIVKILYVAIVVVFLYSWGYVKQQRRNQELMKQLNEGIKGKILDELKKKNALTKVEIEELVKGTKASLFWSKKKIQVTDSKIITKNILSEMLSMELIVEVLNNGPKKYKLK